MEKVFNVTGSKFDFEVTPNFEEWYIKPFSIKCVNGVIHLTKKAQDTDIDPKSQTFRIFKGQFIKTVFNLFCTEEEAEKYKYCFLDMSTAINANFECVRQMYLDAFWAKMSV